MRLFASFGERRAAIDELLSGIGESFTEVAGPFGAVGEPGNGVRAAFTEGGETFADGGNIFTDVGAGFREVGEKSDRGGGGFTQRGKNFDDGGTELLVRRAALENLDLGRGHGPRRVRARLVRS